MSADEHSPKVLSVFFDDMERDYRGGQKRALITTIVICSRFNLKLPAWAREAILEAYISLPKSWDDVFGRPVDVAKGKSVEAERRRRRIGVAVIGRVRELNSQGDEEIAETFKLLNDPDNFYKEFYERLERYRSEFLERYGSNISRGKSSKNF